MAAAGTTFFRMDRPTDFSICQTKGVARAENKIFSPGDSIPRGRCAAKIIVVIPGYTALFGFATRSRIVRLPAQRRCTMTTTKKNSPTHYVYHVREGAKDGDKSFWTRIGAAWPHNDGKGFNLQLDCIPLNGRLTVREPSTDDDNE